MLKDNSNRLHNFTHERLTCILLRTGSTGSCSQGSLTWTLRKYKIKICDVHSFLADEFKIGSLRVTTISYFIITIIFSKIFLSNKKVWLKVTLHSFMEHSKLVEWLHRKANGANYSLTCWTAQSCLGCQTRKNKGESKTSTSTARVEHAKMVMINPLA